MSEDENPAESKGRERAFQRLFSKKALRNSSSLRFTIVLSFHPISANALT